MLVLNIVENFDPLWNLVKEFCDYLIIEDATSEEESFYRLRQFQIYKGSVNCSGIEGNDSVLVWKVSTQALETEYLEEENEFGFFVQILVRSHHYRRDGLGSTTYGKTEDNAASGDVFIAD